MTRFPQPVAVWPASHRRYSLCYLHDHNTLTPSPADSPIREFLEHSVPVHVPWGGSSWWIDRPCESFSNDITAERAILEYTAELPHPVGLIGSEAAIRLGLKYPQCFRVVAAWDSALDFHDLHGQGTSLDTLFDRREQARQHTAILQVRSNANPALIWFGCPIGSPRHRGHDRLHEKLNAIGVMHTFVVSDACPIQEMVEFVVSGLEQETRRLL